MEENIGMISTFNTPSQVVYGIASACGRLYVLGKFGLPKHITRSCLAGTE